ncbi:MAG: class II fumarate hydratase [Ruminococcaceae bacterium]|nr:class II fumarate hydratase [Oscillospiraceae bacterium]
MQKLNDFLAENKVPEGRYWGSVTEKSRRNFEIGTEKMPFEIIYAIAQIKKAAAEANFLLCPDKMTDEKAKLIARVCDEIISGKHDLEFPLPVWQTGSGTQTNMNLNEVIAARGNEIVGKKLLHPNDDVNMSQSSNDVFPTAMHIAAYTQINTGLVPALSDLTNTLLRLEKENSDVIKCGRTHMQDAVPMLFSQEISGWRAALENSRDMIIKSSEALNNLAIGGTAVGTGLNAPKGFSDTVCKILSDITGAKYKPAANLFHAVSCDDTLLFAHSAVKTLAVSLIKIANDIRLLSSGPHCGIGEIRIPQNEPGSSIMPGKVNPTQCEALIMVAGRVIANDAAVSFAAGGGILQLNTLRPLLAYSFLQSVRLLKDSLVSFRINCCEGIEANRDKMSEYAEKSLMSATALTPVLGYERVAEIVKIAEEQGKTLKETCILCGDLNAAEFDRLISPDKMAK